MLNRHFPARVQVCQIKPVCDSVCVCVWRKSVTERSQQAAGCVGDDVMMLRNQTRVDASS